jgi:hypothetical protein
VLIITIKEVNSRNLETKAIKIVYNSAVGDSVFHLSFFFCSTQGLMLGRQVLYHLSHLGHFCLGLFFSKVTCILLAHLLEFLGLALTWDYWCATCPAL